MVRKKSKKIFIIIFIVLVWLNNTSLFSKEVLNISFWHTGVWLRFLMNQRWIGTVIPPL